MEAGVITIIDTKIILQVTIQNTLHIQDWEVCITKLLYILRRQLQNLVMVFLLMI